MATAASAPKPLQPLPAEVLDACKQAALAIAGAKSVLLTSGAGLGVDSGLPDFRGKEGFWRAYPPIAKLGLEFSELATPVWFEKDPKLAWGFYGHRMMLYRGTAPHRGYDIMRNWQQLPHNKNVFVVTSNVDGAFQKAGFTEEQICEIHGTLDFVQCMNPTCGRSDPIFSSHPFTVEVDMERLHANPATWPICDHCRSMARPNVLMFGDWGWNGDRTTEQRQRLHEWTQAAVRKGPVVVVEIGAGRAVPSIRHFSENWSSTASKCGSKSTLVRINVRESELDDMETHVNGISVACGGLRALETINEMLMDL
jgi:NAD-dependent SIR2 family protein deacetylase